VVAGSSPAGPTFTAFRINEGLFLFVGLSLGHAFALKTSILAVNFLLVYRGTAGKDIEGVYQIRGALSDSIFIRYTIEREIVHPEASK